MQNVCIIGGDKMYLNQETKDNIKQSIGNNLGISYEEFESLDIDEQQKLIAIHRKKQKRKNSDEVTVMIGSDENSLFTKVKKGEIIMVGSGEDSIFVRAGISLEETRSELNNKIDDVLYSRPVAFVKKLQRRIRNK